MKKFFFIITLFVSVFSFGQSDYVWVDEFPTVSEGYLSKLNRDSVWWMNFKMDTIKFRLTIMEEINKERKKYSKNTVKCGTSKQIKDVQQCITIFPVIINNTLNLYYDDILGEVSASRRTNVNDFIVEGENIYQHIAQKLVKQWIDSPPHLNAILREEWESVSVGIFLKYLGTKNCNDIKIITSVRGH